MEAPSTGASMIPGMVGAVDEDEELFDRVGRIRLKLYAAFAAFAAFAACAACARWRCGDQALKCLRDTMVE